MRVYKCNRCGTVFQTPPSYLMIRKGKTKTPTSQAVSTAWIDLCSSCTESFLNWLHPNQNDVQERSTDSE